MCGLSKPAAACGGLTISVGAVAAAVVSARGERAVPRASASENKRGCGVITGVSASQPQTSASDRRAAQSRHRRMGNRHGIADLILRNSEPQGREGAKI